MCRVSWERRRKEKMERNYITRSRTIQSSKTCTMYKKGAAIVSGCRGMKLVICYCMGKLIQHTTQPKGQGKLFCPRATSPWLICPHPQFCSTPFFLADVLVLLLDQLSPDKGKTAKFLGHRPPELSCLLPSSFLAIRALCDSLVD